VGVDPALLDDPSYVKVHGTLDDVRGFDASFFGFNPREADVLDPQQRVFLECAWEALEHAGYSPKGGGLGQRAIGVYAGVGRTGYLLQLYANPVIRDQIGEYELGLSNDKDHFTTRVAYKLDLHGPGITVQTACSSGLVSVVLACQALEGNQCDVALAGAIAIHLPQVGGYAYREGGILSPDGHCRAFDADAAGTVPGSGGGVVVLKRLSDAEADGDTIYAVIRGAAINNDGADKIGFTPRALRGRRPSSAGRWSWPASRRMRSRTSRRTVPEPRSATQSRLLASSARSDRRLCSRHLVRSGHSSRTSGISMPQQASPA